MTGRTVKHTVRPLRRRYRKPTDAGSSLTCLNINMALVTLFNSLVCSNDAEVSLTGSAQAKYTVGIGRPRFVYNSLHWT